jgi:FkbM family methyltransferase
MQFRLSALWLKVANLFVWSGLGRFLAKIWHRCMPSFPVKRKIFGLDLYFDSRDHPFVWYAPRKQLEEHENLPETLSKFHGLIWDAGANAGIYSLWLASLGNQVIAFDISPKAISYIMKSAAKNGLKGVTGVPRAFSVEPLRYHVPKTAIAGNKLGGAAGQEEAVAITYKEAAEKFGIPVLIKMDIEGHEEAFLRSKEFKQWLVQNKVALVLELHKAEFQDLLWKDVKTTELMPGRVLVQP